MEHFLRESWRQGQPAFGVWNSIGDTLVAEAIAALGPDYVCVDLQHGTPGQGDLVPLLQAVTAGGSTPIVRVADSSPAGIMKALDAGAHGIIVPLVESAEEAARAVSACRFPPGGRRSFGPFRASIAAGSNEPSELEKVACIVTDGVTAVYLGPSDLSLALGLPPASTEAPEFVSVVDRIRTACAANGVIAGMHCYDGNSARAAVERGFGMVTVAVDLRLFRKALGFELGAARGRNG
jgi:4-hydroxy-2-oxoheptanedioate aldolase